MLLFLGIFFNSLERLDKTWSLVSEYHLKKFRHLSQFTDPTSNYSILRKAQIYNGLQTIPYLGISFFC
jgi:hypothetical protein